MRILLTGADGQLGKEISNQLRYVILDKVELFTFNHTTLDITNIDEVKKIVRFLQPNFIINSAAYTQVDQAEIDRDLAFAVNAMGAANLAEACSPLSIPLIHISTDYVFDGNTTIPYTEKNLALPIGVYGESKYRGEELIRTRLSKHIILRTSWVFGYYGNNFVKTMLRLFQKAQNVRVVNDQFGCPTSAVDLAKKIWEIIIQISHASGVFNEWGTYHYTNVPFVSWYEFAHTILTLINSSEELYKNKCTLTPITTSEYPTRAKRPSYSVLNCQKMESIFDIKQALWASELKTLIKKLNEENNMDVNPRLTSKEMT